jgi:ribosomal protein S8
MILTLTLALQSSGFLSSVTRGGLTPPPMDDLSSYVPEEVTQRNISTRRLWLGLKYWNNEPVLSKMTMISKPTKRVWMDVDGLSNIIRGRDANYIKGLTKPGECMFVTTSSGILEARECVEKRVGGMLLCRVF